MLMCLWVYHIFKSDRIYGLVNQSFWKKLKLQENESHFITTFHLNILTQTHLDRILCNLFLISYNFDVWTEILPQLHQFLGWHVEVSNRHGRAYFYRCLYAQSVQQGLKTSQWKDGAKVVKKKCRALGKR